VETLITISLTDQSDITDKRPAFYLQITENISYLKAPSHMEESTRIITHLKLLSSFEYLIMFSTLQFFISYKNGASYTSSALVVLSSKWNMLNARGYNMWLLWHTKKSFSNTISSTSSSEADLGGKEKPEYVAY